MYANAAVEAGQAFLLQQGRLVIAKSGSFAGTFAGFDGGSTALVTFSDLQFDAAIYVQDGSGAHLELTSNGAAVDEIPLAGTPDTQYAVIRSGGLTSITPTEVFSDGSIPGSVTGTVTVRNATVDGQRVALGGAGSSGQSGAANLILDNATLGPDLLLTVGLPGVPAVQGGTLTVQGTSTTAGQITASSSTTAQPAGNGNALTINIEPGAQLNQEGTIAVVSLRTISSTGSSLFFTGSGTLNNDGQITVGPGSTAQFRLSAQSPYGVTGSGTITVDHAAASLFSAASTQTVDLLGGTLNTSPTLEATIKDWNYDGNLMFNLSVSVNSVQFNQVSDAGGDLQLFGAGKQVGDLHLLGTYATSDFTATQGRFGTSLSVSGHAPPSV